MPTPRDFLTSTYGKIIQSDYDYVMSADGVCEVCLTRGQIRALLGTLDYFGWVTRWYSSSGDIDQQVINRFRDDLARRLSMSCCCDDNQYAPRENYVRVNDDGLQEYSNDLGETWEVDTVTDYRFNGVVLPPPPPESLGEEPNCDFTLNLLAQIQRAQQEYNAQWDVSDDLVGLINAIIAFLASVGFPGLAAVGLPFILITAIVYAVLSAGRVAWNAAFDSTFYQELKCAILLHMPSNGEWSVSQWGAVMDEIDGMTFTIARVWTWNLVRALGANGLSNMSKIPSYSEDTCEECSGGWSKLFDFTTEEYTADWSIVGAETSAGADWFVGEGFKALGSGEQISVECVIDAGALLDAYGLLTANSGTLGVYTYNSEGGLETTGYGASSGWAVASGTFDDDSSKVKFIAIFDREVQQVFLRGLGTAPFEDCDPYGDPPWV